MRKEDAQKIAGWLQGTLLPMIDGCYSFPQEGDDGWQERMQEYLGDIRMAVNIFIQDKLVTEDEVPDSRDKGYDQSLRKLSSKQDKYINSDGDNLTQSEWAALFKARLYKRLKQMAREVYADEIRELKDATALFNFLEGEALQHTEFAKQFYENNYMRSGEMAIADVADYILQERKKAPQTKLFS